MNYKRNEAGDVMVRDAKGNPKYISEKLAIDVQLMRAMHFTIVEAPVPFCEELKCEGNGGIKSATLIDEQGNKFHLDLNLTATDEMSKGVNHSDESTLEIIQPVAEVSPAKSGRKPKK